MLSDAGVTLNRSPRYPRYALPAAINYARKLYDGAHRALIDTDTAYRVMGFAGKSGASSSALGAVRQYGMIEAPKGGVKVSTLGLQILEPASQKEFVEGLRVASRQPTVFCQIIEHFGEPLPRSDEPIRAFLIRNREFSKSGADECIASLRESLTFVDDALGARAAQTEAEENQSISESVTEDRTLKSQARVDQRSEDQSYRIPLTKECIAQLSFTGPISEQAFQRLLRHIELMREVWADD
jgi:hypothetical protein